LRGILVFYTFCKRVFIFNLKIEIIPSGVSSDDSQADEQNSLGAIIL